MKERGRGCDTTGVSSETTPNALLLALEELAPLVRENAFAIERSCALPAAIVERLHRGRFFRLWLPRRYDGLELTLPAALEIYEAAALVDGSFGWSVMIGAGGGLFAAYLEPGSAREIFGPASAVIAGSGAPDGRAELVEGGYRVTGRWRYASGAPYATTFTANCLVTRGGAAVPDADGRPLVRAMAFGREDVRIVETWAASGLRGTASHDFAVENVFVPQRRSFSVFTDRPREPGPLYRLPFQVLTELPVTAVALGIARRFLTEFADLAAAKPIATATRLLADDPTARSAFGRAHAAWRLAKSGVAALAERAWQSAVAGVELGAEQRAEITAACAHAFASLRDAAAELAAAAGMSAIAGDSELARAWRDLLALGAHVSVGPRQLEAAGAELLAAARGSAWRPPA
jgi:alkylation response protein AidB-like acyl-CoA dehydrogenase